MGERSELLKAMAAAYALGDRAMARGPEQQRNPATRAWIDRPQATGEPCTLCGANPEDPMSAEIRDTWDMLANKRLARRKRVPSQI
jgi:hypothetical protein